MSGNLLCPSIPPQSEVEKGQYSYQPCPIDEPPMHTNTFMHYFYYSDPLKHPAKLWGPRLPRKLGDPLTTCVEPLAQGWGIEIQRAAALGDVYNIDIPITPSEWHGCRDILMENWRPSIWDSYRSLAYIYTSHGSHCSFLLVDMKLGHIFATGFDYKHSTRSIRHHESHCLIVMVEKP